MTRIWFLLFALVSVTATAQVTGTLRGTVVDTESRFPIPMAGVALMVDSTAIQTVADLDGRFAFEDVPVGRHDLVVSAIGFETTSRSGIIINSAKETVVELALETAVMSVGTAEVEATRRPGAAMNEMATVSAREFSVAETDRYAGSRGDPARMASNFAGVQGADDSRNDIVVRGNSPSGVLWRVEGIDIPNPNHFAIPGTGGGPVAILNNKFLANSDFYTGAFPAEFGNSTAGVFNLRLRGGNRNKHEFSGQFGFLGTEVLAEGPLNREKGHSYLGMYRYSTVELFSVLGIDIGTSAVPRYQDGAFKVNLQGEGGSNLALWGFGGTSSVDILISDQVSPERNIFGENDRDQYFRSRMGLAGATWSKPFNKDTYLKTTLAHGIDVQDSYHELVFRQLTPENTYQVDSLAGLLRYRFEQQKTSLASSLNRKLNANWTLRTGVLVDVFQWDFRDSIAQLEPDLPGYGTWHTRWDADEAAALLQAYAQVKWRPNDRCTMVAGWHVQTLTLNGSSSWVEPRVGATYDLRPNQRLSLGVGEHSQMQPAYLYFYGDERDAGGRVIPNNRDLGFTRSRHAVLGYEVGLTDRLQGKVEVYYQTLRDVPVDQFASSFSLINAGSGFVRLFPDSLVNSGTGTNYGMEFTLSRAFQDGYFFMVTASVFEAKYKGSDGVERNVEFNGRYAWNALASKAWALNNSAAFVSGVKLTSLGGRWYGPVDMEASNVAREIIWVDSQRNTLQFDPYFRADVKLNLKFNRPETTHEVGVDLVNVTNRKNILKLTYAPDENNNPEESIRKEYQLGFLPVFFYRVDF